MAKNFQWKAINVKTGETKRYEAKFPSETEFLRHINQLNRNEAQRFCFMTDDKSCYPRKDRPTINEIIPEPITE